MHSWYENERYRGVRAGSQQTETIAVLSIAPLNFQGFAAIAFQLMAAPAVILFDGVCGLCNRSVTFVLARDKKERFRFAALQSAAGRALLRAHSLSEEQLDSVVVIANDRVHRRSAAVLEILRLLGFPWSLFGIAAWIPAPVRDAVYDFVARRRYRWFGTTETCRLPGPSERSRFLA